jgi:hypothetical protein
MLAATEAQKWIKDTLTGDATLMGLVTGIYDHVPENAAFPYVTIGETFPTPFRTHSRDGESQLQRIHVWSRYEGFKEATAIAERVKVLLDAATVSTASFSGFAVRESGQTLRDPDGITRHIVEEYRIYAHALAA